MRSGSREPTEWWPIIGRREPIVPRRGSFRWECSRLPSGLQLPERIVRGVFRRVGGFRRGVLGSEVGLLGGGGHACRLSFRYPISGLRRAHVSPSSQLEVLRLRILNRFCRYEEDRPFFTTAGLLVSGCGGRDTWRSSEGSYGRAACRERLRVSGGMYSVGASRAG